jgi:hypothetical protein
LHQRIVGLYSGFGLSEPDPGDAHERAQLSAHGHSHARDPGHVHGEGNEADGDGDDDGESPSTGFLPLSLAISLFVTGLFVLGLIPGVQCG